MYDEDDLLPLSALQHLSFCERQWGLIHLENVWEENTLTVEGHYLHERPDSGGTEVRGDIRVVRGLRLDGPVVGGPARSGCGRSGWDLPESRM